MSSRRDFIRQAGIMGAALYADPSFLAKGKKKIGIQLYSLREQVVKDLAGTIGAISAAGYRELETFGYQDGKFFGLSVQDFAALLKKNGLKSPSGHYGVKDFLFKDNAYEEVNDLIATAQTLGQKYIVVPWLAPEHRKSIDGYKRIAARLSKAGEMCRRAGLYMAYHNHEFEFDNIGGDNGYSVLLRETDPAVVKMEMDIYWVVRAGRDPLQLFRENSGRFLMWHVKDMDKKDRNRNTEIGKGSIDFKPIFAAAKTSGVKHYYVEQENFDIDPYQSIGESIRYIREKLF